ncbi:MAG: hypothetical protein HY901_06395 [Deltaproteobacteria bacterium]|nr:hypothetical protein [Deltaproteobacteria bacterium]
MSLSHASVQSLHSAALGAGTRACGRGPAAVQLAACCVLLAACSKVPIVDIQAGFALADATWFAEEETLFVFYRVEAQQGLGPESQIELSYSTDEVAQTWTSLSEVTPVHTHLPVDCGPNTLCGGQSLHVPLQPRNVALRLRYHREGEMILDAPLTFNVVGPGPAYSNRSLLVYGVFEQANARIQWRARHQFPALRNEEVQGLGLRRTFRVEGPRYGELGPSPAENPYGYAFAEHCPEAMPPVTDAAPLETLDRAVFDVRDLPLSASSFADVCAESTVTDAKGTFQAPAVARKNPEVRPAFPSLHSPIRANTPIQFLLRPCQRTISEQHLAMQQQRLLLEGATEICIDDWRGEGFVGRLASAFDTRIDEVRAQGVDAVLVVALHHDDTTGELADRLEQALEQVLPFERDKSSPRVSGAFVLDSLGYAMERPQLKSLVLWCPARTEPDLDEVPSTSQAACPLLPDMPDLALGPFRFSNLPILPSRPQYLRFIQKYSEGQAGSVQALTFSAPERTPLSDNVPLGEYGVATFFNNEVINAAPTDAFSYCVTEDPRPAAVVFRTATSPEPQQLMALPMVQAATPQPAYSLGLAWDFPFLSRMDYEVTLAGAVTAFSLTVPFGVSASNQAYYGAELWKAGELSLQDTLLQCTRFCDQPTFDSAGVYNVAALFRQSYAIQCYRPRYPTLSDGGFPLDP